MTRQILQWLWHKHGQPWHQLKRGTKAHGIYDLLQRHYTSIATDAELDSLLPAGKKLKGSFRYLYLPPAKRGDYVLPVMIGQMDYTRSEASVQFRVGLFMLSNTGLSSTGYRFESPEGAGRHNYYHAQPIRGFTKESPFPGCIESMPDTVPTVPLDACDSVTLLMCVLVSLYGLEAIGQLLREIGGPIKQFTDSMALSRFRPKYWRVTAGKAALIYKTWDDATVFKDRRRAEGPSVIEVCTEGDFFSIEESRRRIE